MRRSAFSFLFDWLGEKSRKPLVIRGARQVGKTWLVRHFASSQNLTLFEINFEKKPQLISLFESNDPRQILLNLSAFFNRPIDPKTALLFLDEVQAAPEILSKLRWFAEESQELPVIAAGSLLEFILENHSFSMPVGRIHYMHLEPLSFEEFLLAKNKHVILDYIFKYKLNDSIPQAIHEQLMQDFKEYIVIGGMPAAVASWIDKGSLQSVNQIHHDLMATYRDDFAKYKGRIAIERLDEVVMAVPRLLGEKFVYAKVNPAVQSVSVKQALSLLCKGRICHRISGVAANGVPLLSELMEKYLKVIFLDVGLCSAALSLKLDQLSTFKDLSLINGGGIAEQVVGQLLRTIVPFYVEPSLTYWHREERGSSAEVDYVIQWGGQVVPVEVKAGNTGSLKSLHLFMELKGLSRAIRINADLPTVTPIATKGSLTHYQLISLPFYLLGQVNRLLT